MNHHQNNEEIKAPITRVFNLNGLRKLSHSNSADTAENEKHNSNRISNSSFNNDDNDNITKVDRNTIIKTVYKVGGVNFKKSMNDESASIKLKEELTAFDDYVAKEPEKSPETNRLIAGHVSEIDVDERYQSKKVNPVYKSDSEDESEKKFASNNSAAFVNNGDFFAGDSDYVYQDPLLVHDVTNNFKNMSVSSKKTIVAVSQTKDDEIYAEINENDHYLTPVQLKLDESKQIENISFKEQYVSYLLNTLNSFYLIHI